MSDSEHDEGIPGRVRRAFGDHGSFEPVDTDGPSGDEGGDDTSVWTSETTAFDGEVAVFAAGDGRLRFAVTVRVPSLSAVTEGDVADVVETGWFETFERRVVDVGGVTRGDHEFDPDVDRGTDDVVIRFELTDINERRGVDDAGALIDFVEGTYVQGVIPGYEYTDPVSGLISSARRQGGDEVDGGAF